MQSTQHPFSAGSWLPGRAAFPRVIVATSIAFFIACVGWGWIGYIGSDDATYWIGGKGWLEHFPYVGGLGSSRETIAIPLAISIRILGDNWFSLVAPTLLYAIGLVIVVVSWIHRSVTPTAAVAVAALLVTCPLLVVWSSIASVDVIEAFFVFSSLYLFYRAIVFGPSWRRLLGAGALAGLGMLTRETTAFLLLAYGLLFLIGYGMPRRFYWYMAIGFLPIILAEMAYFAYAAGDPLYRFMGSLHHDATIDRSIDQGGGVPIINPLIDPFLALFVSHYFALLFWFGIPLGLWLTMRRIEDVRVRHLLTITATVSVTWFIAAAAPIGALPLLPRYFMVSAIGAVIVAGTALGYLWDLGRRRAAIAIGTIIVTTNLIAIDLENKDYMFGEWSLAAVTSPSGPIIHTDPETARRAELPLRWAGTLDKVAISPPAAGDYYFYNPLRARTPTRLIETKTLDAYQPKQNWIVIDQREPPVKGLRLIFDKIANQDVLPGFLQKLLRKGHSSVTLYRLPG